VGQDICDITESNEVLTKPPPAVKVETPQKLKQTQVIISTQAAPAPVKTQPIAKKVTILSQDAIPGYAIGDRFTLHNNTRTEKRVAMNRMRLRIAERLKESQNTSASLTTFNEIDMRFISLIYSALMALRSKYKEEVLKKHEVKLGFMGAFVKAVCQAVEAVPSVNARIEKDTIVFADYIDISVAVSTPKGLVTPVIRNCETLSIVQVENCISFLGKKAKDNKISLEDMQGGTFTISNGGVFGSLYGTPIINTPQSAILGMHAIKDRCVVINGKVILFLM
jgi:2-oxoglutarate dehydrogenase E2 component (dihydrolipoamide succinyltransferase)